MKRLLVFFLGLVVLSGCQEAPKKADLWDSCKQSGGGGSETEKKVSILRNVHSGTGDTVMIYDNMENVGLYADKEGAIRKAVQFAREFDPAGPDGRYEIAEGIYATVQRVTTRPAEERNFEAHRQYVDVHIVLEGSERLDVAPPDGEDVKLIQEYDGQKDLLFFTKPKDYSTIILKPGWFAVFFPADGHRPCCSVGKPQAIRKICVKIKYTLLSNGT